MTYLSPRFQAVTIPVMAKARIGHFAEAQVSLIVLARVTFLPPHHQALITPSPQPYAKILEAIGCDYIDESEVLTTADGKPLSDIDSCLSCLWAGACCGTALTVPHLLVFPRVAAKYHIDKTPFKLPFVCGARNLGEALRRIHEGAAMIRTKGAAGTGDVHNAVHHVRTIKEDVSALR